MERRIKSALTIHVLLCTVTIGWSQTDYPWLRTGDELYVNRAYTEAETAYRKALEEKDKPKTSFNLGNTVYRQNRIPEAVEQYENTIASTKDPNIKADAWYNLGNAHYQNEEYDKSVQAYKESLKLRPEDEDAKKNLMMSLRQLRAQQQQQQQDQQKQEEENKKEQNQDQPQNSDPNQKDKQDQQQSQSQDKNQSDEEQQHREELSKEEAKEILKAIEREDQRVQEKLKKGNAKALPPVKDW